MEHTYVPSFDIEEAEDREKPIREKFSRLDEITHELLALKQERNKLKKELVALSDIEPIKNNEDKITGFRFHPLLSQHVKNSVTKKHIAASLDFDEYDTFLQIQAQEVVDWNDVHQDIKARREVEANNSVPSSAFVVDTLDWTEAIIGDRTRYRIQSRIVNKTKDTK
jgi:hypothetical protein